MKAFPFNNWLQESWKRDGQAPHLFIELMDGTIEHSAIKFEDIFGIGGLQFYSDLESKTIKRAIIIYPCEPTIITNVFDGKALYFTAAIDDLKLTNIVRSSETLSMPEAWNSVVRFLIKQTTARVQYAGNIPPTI
jgi:hypothetical protein